jgi:hypothetical protein
MDSYALTLVNQLRSAIGGGLPPVDTSVTSWLDNAVTHGLGTKDYSLVQI